MDTRQFKKLLKDIKFPGGKDAFVNPERGYAKWYKRHGHRGSSVIARVTANARAHGFTQAENTQRSDATGDRVAQGTVLIRDGVSMTLSSFYGQTAYENHFTIDIRADIND
jgi:hypothetical protein